MMNIITRYIGKTVALATGLSSLIIASVLLLIPLLTELKNIGEGDYGLVEAILYVFLRLPNALYQFSPMLMLLGSIIGLSILSSHKELAVMRAYGFSTGKIMYSVLVAVFLLTLGISMIGEWIAPDLSYHAGVRKENARNAGQAVVTAAGIWLHVDNNFIHIRHVIGRHLLEGVTRYEFDDNHQLQAAYYAKKLTLENKHWQMYDAVKTMFYKDRTKSQAFPQAEWNLKFNPTLLKVGLVEASEMSLPKLAKFSHYLVQNGLQATEYQFEFWRRVLQPLASVVMIFLAIPFVLGALSTVTIGWRILAGIVTGFAFFIFNALLGQLCIVYQLPAILAALLPLLVFSVLGVLLTNRLIRR